MSYSALDEGYSIHIRKRGDRHFATVAGVGVFASGDTADAALAALGARYVEMSAFAKEAGIDIGSFGGRRAGAGSWRRSLLTAAIIVVCFGVAMVPLSYALSTALERTITNSNLAGGRQFWQGMSDRLIRAAAPDSAPSPEEQAKTVAAIRALVERSKPYIDAIRPAFGCTADQGRTTP